MGGSSSKTDDEDTTLKKHGEPMTYDPTFRGPIKNRSCTDVLCCIIFTFFVLAFLCIGIYAFAMGDPRYLIYPIDSQGNLCGTGNFSDKPYLFYFNLIECAFGSGLNLNDLQSPQFQFCPTTQICVSSCPTEFWMPLPGFNSTNAICNYSNPVITTLDEAINAVKSGECAPFYLPSTSVIYHCVPSSEILNQTLQNSQSPIAYNGTSLSYQKNGQNVTITYELMTNATETMSNFLGSTIEDYGVRILGDVTSSWWIILIFVSIAMVLSFIWIVLMRWLSGVIIWLSFILFGGFFIFGIYYCFNKYVTLRDTQPNLPWIFTTNFSYYTNLKETWLAMGIIAVICLAIIILVLLFLITRIRIAIALVKEASRAVGHMIFTLYWPLIPYALQMVLLAFWGGSAICLASISRTNLQSCSYLLDNSNNQSGNSSVSMTTTSSTDYTMVRCSIRGLINAFPCNSTEVDFSGSICNCFKNGQCDVRYTYVLQAFQLFTWFWLMNFIIAIGQLTLAGAFASYYWAFNKPKDIPLFPVASSLGRAFRYHTGSMAFGALIIAIIQFIIVILQYLDHKLKGRQNIIARCFLKCCICCFFCLERFMKFINKNAYIMIAIYGKNFCTSAFEAFNLLLRNIIRVVVVDKVTDFLLFISKLFIVASIGVLAYFFFAREIPGVTNIIPELQLNYYLIPVLIIICATYIVASSFFSVYTMGVDTLFLCFCEDLERHDGSAEKPYYMNKELMHLLGKKNKFVKEK